MTQVPDLMGIRISDESAALPTFLAELANAYIDLTGNAHDRRQLRRR